MQTLFLKTFPSYVGSTCRYSPHPPLFEGGSSTITPPDRFQLQTFCL
jgi:hypothetical protein